MKPDSRNTLSAEDMAQFEDTPEMQAKRAAYDAQFGRHDELQDRALNKPAPGPALLALLPRPTMLGAFRLPPITAAHYALLQESGIAFGRKMFEDEAIKLTIRDMGEAIYFFTLTPDEFEAILGQGGMVLFRRQAIDLVLKTIPPGALGEYEQTLVDHIAAGSATRVLLAPERDAAEADESPLDSAPAKSSMVSDGSSSWQPVAPASSTPPRALTT